MGRVIALSRGGGPLTVPTEAEEQKVLAQYLNAKKIFWTHVPNEGKRSYKTAAYLRALGMRSGMPDVLIFDRPPKCQWASGVAIELKRVKGSRVDAQQHLALHELAQRNWITRIAYGANDAIEFVQSIGF